MNKIQLYLLLGLVIFATGCPNEPSKSFKNKDTFVSNVNDYLRDAHDQYKANVTANPNEAKRIRNDALEAAMAVVDDNYTDFINRIETRRSTTSFVADVIDIGASAATGITKGERPNQILGIAITAFRGFRKSGDLNFYKQQTTPILISKMDDNRAQVHAAILQKKDRGVDRYSLNEAIRDIVAYYNAGTLIRAFTELSKDTAAQAQASERQVEILQGLEINPIPTVRQENVSDAYFREQVSLIEQLRAIKNAKPEDQPKLTENLKTKLETIWRSIAATDKFKPFIEQLSTEPKYKTILDGIKDDNFSAVSAEQLLTLIIGFGQKITENEKDVQAAEEFVRILRNANQ